MSIYLFLIYLIWIQINISIWLLRDFCKKLKNEKVVVRMTKQLTVKMTKEEGIKKEKFIFLEKENNKL